MADIHTSLSLSADARNLGVQPGMTLMTYASLGKIGYTVGGPITVIRAFLDALGATGTLVMTAESPQRADPTQWRDEREHQ